MRTPLHIAAAEGNLAMAQFLLERGALVHKKAGSYFYTGRSDYRLLLTGDLTTTDY